MEHYLRDYFSELSIGPEQSHKNLTMFPLLVEDAVSLDYLTLDEALSKGFIHVEELDHVGSVPEIRFMNKAKERVLILDGEELVGAKQNRIVNTTIILEADSITIIPVSCVEQGRWSHKSARFKSEERIMSAELRAMKARHVRNSVRSSGNFRSDQGALWDKISEKANRMNAPSPSMAMSEIYKQKTTSIRDYLDRFRPAEKQVGGVFLINGNVVGLDSFAKPETLTKVFKKLVESYALDAVDWFEKEKTPKVQESQAAEFLKACLDATVESRPSVALGTDCRLDSPLVNGFALVLDEKVLHLSVFAQDDENGSAGSGSGMRRFSSRRRSRG